MCARDKTRRRGECVFWCGKVMWIYSCPWHGCCQERPYHADRTTSRLLCEVKLRRAGLVLRWGTTWEAPVLFLLFTSLITRVV
ncbi:unnamed protein product, partial [Ectocarpus sp. 12 AP-2014]